MKTNITHIATAAAAALLMTACGTNTQKHTTMEHYSKGTFGYDRNFLQQYDSVVILTGEDGKAQIIISPKYQAKVFTSTAEGLDGASYGWINYKAFDTLTPHMNGYGGENRFWLGPEGGRYSVYFAPGAAQEYDNWQTPAPIDSEPWSLKEQTAESVTMEKEMHLLNYCNTPISLLARRTITLIDADEIKKQLHIAIPPEVKSVAYTTRNTITNTGEAPWTRQTGTVCIWMLDMFTPSPDAVTIVPYKAGDEAELGKVATTDYFGAIPPQWLRQDEKALYLKVDGKHRGKIGIPPLRAKKRAGNYNPAQKHLTITTFDVDENALYLNQEWNPDKDPLSGDAVNAYNDGPLEDGTQMGPFYEIESTSPAAFLEVGQQQEHNHNVYHFVGEEQDLDPIARELLGVSLAHVKKIFSE